jgi:hypothetical protein
MLDGWRQNAIEELDQQRAPVSIPEADEIDYCRHDQEILGGGIRLGSPKDSQKLKSYNPA